MTKVSPSILSADFSNLAQVLRELAQSGADWVHIDVMDGLFVPNLTIGPPVIRSIRAATRLPLDVHLMIDRPIRYVDSFCDAGADYLTVHVEADTPENTLVALKRIAARGVKPAISLKPGTEAEAAIPFLPCCAMILVMTVEPGFGGQAFMAEMLPKLRKLHALRMQYNPQCLLEVDGGVNAGNARACVEAGADVLVAGSAYYHAADHAAFVRQLRG